MISLKPTAPVVTNQDFLLQRVYFFVPTSIEIPDTIGNAQRAIFSMGGGQVTLTDMVSIVPPTIQGIIACGVGTELFLDSYSINIGKAVSATNYQRGIEVDSTFKIYKNGILADTEVLATSKNNAYINSFNTDLSYNYEDLIYFTFNINSIPPVALTKIYLNLILAFSYAI
jgi:hypothetical protein